MHKFGEIAVLSLLPLLAGCSWLEPKLVMPEFIVPKEYTPLNVSDTLAFVSPSEVVSGSAVTWKLAQNRVAEPRGNWWEMYNDAELNDLMVQAMQDNPSLQVMAARVKQARAAAGLANSQLFPLIYGTGSVTREKMAGAEQFQSDNTKLSAQTTYKAMLNGSYELDLFGRLSGEAKSARLSHLATKDLYESTKLSLQADVVQAYYAVKASHAAKKAMDATLDLGKKNLDLVKRQLELGDISQQSYRSQEAALLELRNNALTLQQQVVAVQNRLALLVGKTPGSVVVGGDAPLASLPPMIPADVPATVLERRPDVAAAQKQLASANAGIGAARAAFFPQISITGRAGYAAQDFSNLFQSNTSTWSFGPAVTLPIFQGATNLSNLRRSWGVYEEAVAIYKEQVLGALGDVDDALTTHRITLEQADGQQQAAAQLAANAVAAQRQYDVGDVGLADLYAAQQQALVAQMDGQQALLDAYTASAQLVRALGGGWVSSTETK